MFAQFRSFFALLVFLFSLNGCQSISSLKMGIQPGYMAVNPAAIAAIPVFILPNPAEAASVDSAILKTEQIIPMVEKKIIGSFVSQHNINGYDYSLVRKAIGSIHPNILDNLSSTMKNVAKLFSSREVKVRSQITPACLARKQFLDFYSFCLLENQNWMDQLNAFSAKVLNADTALITVIESLQSTVNSSQTYQISMRVAVVLVDTNNGKLIWGNDVYRSLATPKKDKFFPKWSQLVDSIFVSAFWEGFPGRIPENKIPQFSSLFLPTFLNGHGKFFGCARKTFSLVSFSPVVFFPFEERT